MTETCSKIGGLFEWDVFKQHLPAIRAHADAIAAALRRYKEAASSAACISPAAFASALGLADGGRGALFPFARCYLGVLARAYVLALLELSGAARPEQTVAAAAVSADGGAAAEAYLNAGMESIVFEASPHEPMMVDWWEKRRVHTSGSLNDPFTFFTGGSLLSLASRGKTLFMGSLNVSSWI
ncbi:uncharacterized protein LOC111257319 [Setaria italica]|uniref:uncharacterized protein LOC111257319 n=1 Tax=Setaria italica TaxID=4555 RepID=UPI000BE5BCCB|nr:uncharacterized protein LOC111257319 [Setaria italica]